MLVLYYATQCHQNIQVNEGQNSLNSDLKLQITRLGDTQLQIIHLYPGKDHGLLN